MDQRVLSENEVQMFSMLKSLLITTGLEIDEISKQCNIRQTFVSQLFVKLFQSVLEDLEEQLSSNNVES